ncbi:MAG: peptidylprolyl isomerase [Desulfobacterium sp.]|nr:peptidylprolyl isomerase [Desulfobacterium sp.]
MKSMGMIAGFIIMVFSFFGAGFAYSGDAGETASQVVARVGDREITRLELGMVKGSLWSTPRGKGMGTSQALDLIVEKVLFAKEARALGLDKDPAIQLQIRNARESILARAYVRSFMAGPSKISQDDIVNYYNSHSTRFSQPEMVRARHILFRAHPTATSQEIATIEARALSVKKEIIQGADFALMVKKYSEDPGTAKKGGDLGFFARNGKIKALSDAAFAMDPGEVRGPIRTSVGYHLLMVEEKKTTRIKPVEKVQEEIVATLTREKNMNHAAALKKGLEKKFKVEIGPVSSMKK